MNPQQYPQTAPQPASPAPMPGALPPQPGATVTAGGQAQAPARPHANPNSTQNTLQIAEIRDGIVIMNDGTFRCVIMVKSINFDLMSQQEQEAVEYSYQGFEQPLFSGANLCAQPEGGLAALT